MASVVLPGNIDRKVATLLAVERLAVIDEKPTKLSKWYEPGRDFCVYAGAQGACQSSKAYLSKLKLSDEERQLLSAPWEPESVTKKLLAIQEEQDRKAKRSKAKQATSDFVNNFCKVAEQTSEIIKIMIPQSPEYTVTWGLLTLLFKTVVTKSQREESLDVYIKSLSAHLPLVSFYRDTYPTIAMKLVVARIFSEVLKLLEEALVYYRNGRLSKLVDAVWQPTEHKFDVHIASIEAEKKKLDELVKVANTAGIVDIQDVVKDTGKVAAAVYDSVEKSTFAIGIGLEMLNRKMDSLEARTDQMLKFEMLRYTQKLIDNIHPEGWDAEEQLALILDHGFRLSPKDRWEENGILDKLLKWSNNNEKTLLWIGGSSGNQEPWVTELSADLVQALQTQQLTLTYVFCTDHTMPVLTPIQLLRSLIVQMLTSDSELAYKHSEVFNKQRFKRAVSFPQVWRIFEQLALKLQNLFIIVDRVEECQPDQSADVNDNLLPSLVELASKTEHIRIIVTSAYWPPETVAGHSALEDVYIDTGKKPARKK